MKKMMGLVASVVLMGSGAAFAHDHAKKTEQTQGAGGSGTMGMSSNQLTGKVVKNDKKTIYVEHAGVIVPLKIEKTTQLDPSLKQVQDLKEGDEIRASFEVRKTENIATHLERSSSGMGGSGTEMMSPDSSINQSPGTLPSKDSTGGSGQDLNSPDSSKGSDVNSGAQQSHPSGDY